MTSSRAWPGVVDALGVVALLGVELGVERAATTSPITPFIGVRISWLMVARNSDFTRDDRSASSRACSSASASPPALGDVLGRERDADHHAGASPTGETVMATGTVVPSGRVQLDLDARQLLAAAADSSRSSEQRLASSAAGSPGLRPITSSARCPKSFSAAGFQAETVRSRLQPTTASREEVTIEPSVASSAVRSATFRSRSRVSVRFS